MGETTGTNEKLKTEVVGWIEHLIPLDEEQNPVPVNPSPGMLVARVAERLAQAAMAITEYGDDDDDDEETPNLMQIGVYFVGAAAFAINGIPHVHSDATAADPIAVKRVLIRKFDQHVDEMLSGDNRFTYEEDPDLWLRGALSLLTGACQAVCELESLSPEDDAWLMSFGDDDDEDWSVEDIEDWDDDLDLERDDEKVSELRAAIADSLFQAAIVAAAAGQWFVDKHEEAEGRRRRPRPRARRSRPRTRGGAP